jgi:hypothetical protein
MSVGMQGQGNRLIIPSDAKMPLWRNNVPKMAPESVIEKGTGGCGRLVLRASVNLL